MEAEKSDYERLRDANIARNAAVMRALGLDDSDFMRHLARDAPKPAKKAPAKRKRDDGPARRSSRLASLEAEAKQPEEDEADEAAEPAPPTAAAHRAEAKAQRKQGASIVGTASYEHTLMRVRTMSEKALANRVRAIERAAGKHAVVKMRLFARVLCLEGYEALAADAAAALERLVDADGA